MSRPPDCMSTWVRHNAKFLPNSPSVVYIGRCVFHSVHDIVCMCYVLDGPVHFLALLGCVIVRRTLESCMRRPFMEMAPRKHWLLVDRDAERIRENVHDYTYRLSAVALTSMQ